MGGAGRASEPLPAARPAAVPSIADVEAIGSHPLPVPRNLRITQAYHELSAATGAVLGSGAGANWCTFATWASKQAGQSIRGDDLSRKLEDAFVHAPAVQAVVARVRDLRRAVGRAVDADEVLAALRQACAPLLTVTRVADAVARGNKKVFDEIGAEFARFVTVLGPGGDEAALETFLDRFRPGDPPDGQRLLAAAFSNYQQARRMSDPKRRAERMFLANVQVGVHEQTRLQPEIADALDAPVPDPAAIAGQLLDSLFAGRLARVPGAHDALAEATARLLEPLRAVVRRVVTEELMMFTLPDGRAVPLGRDLTGGYPARLATIEDPEVVEFLAGVDPSPDSLVGSGADDWADLADRMHMILDLFRQQHDNADLFGPPFTPQQVQVITAGGTPDGRL